MKSEIRWLRTSYITGAVADGLAGILLLIPRRMGETEFRYSMGLGAARKVEIESGKTYTL